MEHELLRLPGVYQLDINGSIQVLLPSTHTTKSPLGPISTKKQPARLCAKEPTLSPPRFLLHQCTLMKGNAPTMNPVVLHRKNHDLLYCDNEEKLRNGAQVVLVFVLLSVGSSPPRSSSGGWKNKKCQWSVLCRNQLRENSHPVRLLRPGGVCVCVWGSSRWRAVPQSTGSPAWARSPRHSEHICPCSPLSLRGAEARTSRSIHTRSHKWWGRRS